MRSAPLTTLEFRLCAAGVALLVVVRSVGFMLWEIAFDSDQAIVVTGVKRKAEDVLGGVSVLDEAELTRSIKPSIGDTLAKLPGVSATSFGPTASAPVLRGLSGDRVRVLTDGIGTLDLSSSGPDHAISINPITAERIEVLRGPAALLFGSSAIGGVVNVIDTRIPRHVPDGPIGVDAIARYHDGIPHTCLLEGQQSQLFVVAIVFDEQDGPAIVHAVSPGNSK